MKKYGDAIKYQRIKVGKSLLQIQKETGISNQNLSRWEKNEVIPNIDFCVKLADYYNISLDELIDRDFNEVGAKSESNEESVERNFNKFNKSSLNAEELELVEIFRSFPEQRQDTLLDTFRGLANEKKNIS